MWWPVIAAVAAGAGYAGAVEPFWIRPVTYEVVVPGLDPGMDGFRILHLSDLHGRVDVFARAWFWRWAAGCQLAVVTGDLFAWSLSRARVARALNALAATLPTYYVSGNHDWRRGRLAVEPWDPGPGHLDNRAVPLAGGRLWLAGLPDLKRGRPDWAAVVAALPVEGPAVLLSHRPDAVLHPACQRFALVLSGHTHGGQVCLPGGTALVRHTRLPWPYAAGRWEWAPGHTVITSRGLGESELPVRFACRPEVVQVVLRAAAGARVAEGANDVVH
ncbi:MAG: metallophosphoesterase [Firmicutes bacterium]|nr:metallophosphoesterase [Alicyclobacillaceae bacterium]MCL6496783.1 metallophosphoesterase [Bacillota bacterium]